MLEKRRNDWWSWTIKASTEEDYDRREKLYRDGLKRFPRSPELHGSLAVFLGDVAGKDMEAEEHYKEAVKLDPDNALNIANYAEFLLIKGERPQADEMFKKAKVLNEDYTNQLAAALEVGIGILARINDEDDADALNALRKLFSDGFPRSNWTFNKLEAFIKERCSPEDRDLYSAVIAGILDPDPAKVPDIDLLEQLRSAAMSQKGKSQQV